MPSCPHCSTTVPPGCTYCSACGNALDDTPISPGDPLRGKILAGGYEIEGLVGAGAMANVYRAQQTTLGRTVAVKVMHAHLMNDETMGRRFINEARAASRLNHPHSLAVIDFGRMDSGQPYMVMEYLRGVNLERLVRREGLLSFDRIIDILRQLLAALLEAHELNIIHRDLKLENIVIEPIRSGGDYVKVVDFGLAKLMSTVDDVSITATGTVCGTPDFMSPEQCRGDKLDARSDLYAVGVNLFVLLTGRVPFVAETPTQALLLHLTKPAPDPRQVAPDRLIPDSLARITLKALEKDPADRYQSADAFSAALEACRPDVIGAASTTVPPRTTTVRCSVCGGFAPAGTKYCVECGAPVSVEGSDGLAEGDSIAPCVSSQLSFVARDEALVSLLDDLQRTRKGHAVLVRGEAGVGKTRLLQEFSSRAMRRGHEVVCVSPDPWLVGVAYHGLREAVRGLADLPANGGSESAWTDASDSARRGLREIFGTRDGTPVDRRSRRVAVRDALSWALLRAHAGGGAAVLVFDDLQFIDAVSQRAARDLLEAGLSESTYLIGTHTLDFDPAWSEPKETIEIERLSSAEAMLVLEQSGMMGRLLEVPTQPVTPLFLEQAVMLADAARGSAPVRLGDLIHQRLARFDALERQALQAVAVLSIGSIEEIQALIERDESVDQAVESLVHAGLLKHDDGNLRFRHHLLREVVLNTIPAGVFRQLCGRALQSIHRRIPTEARAWLMLGAEEAFEALLALDQLGSEALARDDGDTAIETYRRALDFARSELARGNLDDPMHAVVVFGRKLGEALTSAGRPGDADGVLRETLDFAEQGTEEQARVLLAVARAAYERTRVSDAIRAAKQASAIAARCGEDSLHNAVEGLLHRWGG